MPGPLSTAFLTSVDSSEVLLVGVGVLSLAGLVALIRFARSAASDSAGSNSVDYRSYDYWLSRNGFDPADSDLGRKYDVSASERSVFRHLSKK